MRIVANFNPPLKLGAYPGTAQSAHHTPEDTLPESAGNRRSVENVLVCPCVTAYKIIAPELLPGERGALCGHHATAADDGLFHKSVASGQAAGKRALSEKILSDLALLVPPRNMRSGTWCSSFRKHAVRSLVGSSALARHRFLGSDLLSQPTARVRKAVLKRNQRQAMALRLSRRFG